MSEEQAASPPAAAPPGRLTTFDDLERALERQTGPFLQRVKQTTLEVIDEVGSKHGGPLADLLRKMLVETVGPLLQTEVAALVDRLKPAVAEGRDAVRQDVERWFLDLKELLTRTVVEGLRVHLPELSRRAGRRVIDYVLASTLFGTAAVLGCVGILLGLRQAGLPDYAAFLISGGVALAGGLAVLKLRGPSPSEPRPSGSDQRPIAP
jgi:hypothetical protein